MKLCSISVYAMNNKHLVIFDSFLPKHLVIFFLQHLNSYVFLDFNIQMY